MEDIAEDKYCILHWAGSKYKHREFIARHVPAETTEVVSPFFGSGAVELEILRRRPDVRIRASDFDISLVIFWRAMLASPADVAMQLKGLFPRRPVSKAAFERMAASLQCGSGELVRSEPALSAARFWLVNHLCFSGVMVNPTLQKPLAKRLCNNREDRLRQLRCFKPPLSDHLKLEHQDCFEAIERSSQDALLFLDPPYVVSSPNGGPGAKRGPKGKICGQCGRCGRVFKFCKSFNMHIAASSCEVVSFDPIAGFVATTDDVLLGAAPGVATPHQKRRGRGQKYTCGANWGLAEHHKLREVLATRSKWVLCHEESSDIRKLYAGLRVVDYEDRKNRVLSVGRRELLILSPWVSERLSGETLVAEHSGRKACSECGATFSKPWNLKVHRESRCKPYDRAVGSQTHACVAAASNSRRAEDDVPFQGSRKRMRFKGPANR